MNFLDSVMICFGELYFVLYSEVGQRLIQLEDIAKAEGKGQWGPQQEHSKHVRNVKWVNDNPRMLVDSFKQKPIDGNAQHST